MLSLSHVLSPYIPLRTWTWTWTWTKKIIMDNDKDILQKLMEKDTDFMNFWTLYRPNEIRFPNRKIATYRLWRDRLPATQKAMLAYVTENKVPEWKNPYFFVQEFLDPEPKFLRGDEPCDIVQVRYNGAYKLCTRATMELFNLEFVRNW